MAAEISSFSSGEPSLIRGDGGVFDVVADAQLIFSKHKAGRFPEPGEVLGLLEAAAQA